MKELIISQIAPIAVTAVIAILAAIIKSVGDIAIDVLVKKKEEIEQRIKVSGHEQDLNTAKEIWNIVEEKYRITENAKVILGNKSDMFNRLLLDKIPGLTQQNLSDLRQAIAGEINKGKIAVAQNDSTQQITNLQQINSNLQIENSNLKATIDQITNTISNASVQA